MGTTLAGRQRWFFVVASQPYTILEELRGGVEVRHYPAHTLISVDVEAPFQNAGTAGFRPLVSYISGANQARQTIAMTSPVTHLPHSGARHTISFVLPEGMSLEDAPVPADTSVRVVEKPDATVAALHWRGGFDERVAHKAEAALLASVQSAGRHPSGAVFFARYDPPMTPVFFRRNEALLEIA
jgi:hypothetical protein